MDQPLGNYAGLSCEIDEAIECLNGKGPTDVMKLTYELGAHLFVQAGLAKNKKVALKEMQKLINTKRTFYPSF